MTPDALTAYGNRPMVTPIVNRAIHRGIDGMHLLHAGPERIGRTVAELRGRRRQ